MPSFVDPVIAKDFECGVCLEIFTVPVQIGCNEGHIFCRKCVLGLLSSSVSLIRCPLCRGSCKVSQSLKKIPFIERQINNLMVKCTNHKITKEKAAYIQSKHKSNHNNNTKAPPRRSKRLQDKAQTVPGNKRKKRDQEETHQHNHNKRRKLNDEELCRWIGTLSDINMHLKTCPLQLISCEYCNDKLLRKNYAHHIRKCGSVSVQCQQCKMENIPRSQMQEHIRFMCPETIIDCDLCRKAVKRSMMELHSHKKCPEAYINCTFHRFGCKVMFQRKHMAKHNTSFQHSHLVKVTNSHLVLEKRVGKLEEQMDRVLHHDLESMVLDHREEDSVSSPSSSSTSSYDSPMSSSAGIAGWSTWSSSSSSSSS